MNIHAALVVDSPQRREAMTWGPDVFTNYVHKGEIRAHHISSASYPRLSVASDFPKLAAARAELTPRTARSASLDDQRPRRPGVEDPESATTPTRSRARSSRADLSNKTFEQRFLEKPCGIRPPLWWVFIS